MKTKKEKKTKCCSKCGITYKKKEVGVWAIKFPYWICKACGLAAKKAFKKLDEGKFKEGASDLLAVNWGISVKEADSKISKTSKGLKNKQTRKVAYDSMRKQGMSKSEIKNACIQAGWPDITK